MNYILMPGFNRPEFFDIVLESLTKCPEIERYKILFVFENNVDTHYYNVIDKYIKNKSNIEIQKRDINFGLTRNILEGMKSAFEKTDDYIIIVEDDVKVSPDFLKFNEYCFNNFYSDDLFSINATSRGNDSFINKVLKDNWYVPYGVLIFKNNFNKYLKKHCKEEYYANRQNYVENYYPNWEHGKKWNEQAGLIQRIRSKNNLKCLYPFMQRAQHIGFYGKNRILKIPEYKFWDFDKKVEFVKSIIKEYAKLEEYSFYKDPGYKPLIDNYDWDKLELINE